VFDGDDGSVIGPHHNSGSSQARQLETDCCIVMEIEHGPIKSSTESFFYLHNQDRFWP
jgi:hypothetical protein